MLENLNKLPIHELVYMVENNLVDLSSIPVARRCTVQFEMEQAKEKAKDAKKERRRRYRRKKEKSD